MAEKTFKTIESSKFVILGQPRDDEDPINSVEGTLIEKETILMRGNDVGRYHLETEDGEKITVLGATTLDEKMLSVDIGAYVRITLEPQKTRTSSGNEMKNFTVEVAE